MADSRDGLRKNTEWIEHLIGSETKQILKKQKGTCFNSVYTKIGIIQRIFSWPLYKDDMQITEWFYVVINFMLSVFYQNKKQKKEWSHIKRTQESTEKAPRAKTETIEL